MNRHSLAVIFLGGILLFPALPVLASTWNAAYVMKDVYFFFDADTVEKNKDTVDVWIKTVQTTKAKEDGTWSIVLRWHFNCSRRTSSILTYTTYDKDGNMLHSFNIPDQEVLVVPDSSGEAMLKMACKANFPNDASGNEYEAIKGNDPVKFTEELVKRFKEDSKDPLGNPVPK